MKMTSTCDPPYQRLNSEHLTRGVSEIKSTMIPLDECVCVCVCVCAGACVQMQIKMYKIIGFQ